MGFHPRMYSVIKGMTLLDELSTTVVDDMAIDQWHVSCARNAIGHYVSLHPRFIVMLDNKHFNLATDKHTPTISCAACFIPAGTELWSRFDSSFTLRHIDIHLTQKRLAALTKVMSLPTSPVFFNQIGELAPFAALLSQSGRTSLIAERLAECIILEMLRDYSDEGELAVAEDWMSRIEEQIADNLNRRIELEELAEATGLSTSQLNRAMRQRTGYSTYQWVLRQKINHGKVLLHQGLSYTEVANLTGFSDQAHFNRVFKSVVGISPSHWTFQHKK